MEFLQIGNDPLDRPLELIDIYATIIPAKDSRLVLERLKDSLPEEVHELSHLRRLNRIDDEGEIRLDLAICSVDTIDRDKLDSIIQGLPCSKIRIEQAPKFPARTKEQCTTWNTKVWPSFWRSNPNCLPAVLTADEKDQMTYYVNKLAEQVRDKHKIHNKDLPIATFAVDPDTQTIVATDFDARNSSGNPLEHSVMRCIRKVAELELERRREPNAVKGYLCLNMHLYTTHEPCSMCAMAMVHSRVGRLVYIRDMPQTGAINPLSAQGYCIHNNAKLNWRFNTWKPQDDLQIDLPDVSDTINA
ncbi:hypothetical protein CANCADRAFT_182 [Tortispora caseinolytica NRRL Y-17796]|uniref:CMP/dCMP-type deaminase domain-containing protein n=1 Tax=Tortispora caseinolytica NRRL Y-17796 TaxID=767744 RepID=A0A1E4TIS1_9ASCO|nr:hypothetical protein CANCADRAFT_182 [Tortispora caseinolytica NRRL Y-17796]